MYGVGYERLIYSIFSQKKMKMIKKKNNKNFEDVKNFFKEVLKNKKLKKLY